MKIKTWRDPYDTGVALFKSKLIEFHPGVTVLTGCNGCGKSTLLRNIESECKGIIPCHKFDNLTNGGGHAVLDSVLSGVPSGFDLDSFEFGTTMLCSSEGEAITMHMVRQFSLYDSFFKEGHFTDQQYRLSQALGGEPTVYTTEDRVLLFDATDSGLSVDSVCDLNQLFKMALSRANELGVNLYIIVAANEYELCRSNDCFDVRSGRYVTFSNYDDYREYILQSRKYKDARIQKESELFKKHQGKELTKFFAMVNEIEPKVREICAKQQLGERLSREESSILRGSSIREYVRRSRYIEDEMFDATWEMMLVNIGGA